MSSQPPVSSSKGLRLQSMVLMVTGRVETFCWLSVLPPSLLSPFCVPATVGRALGSLASVSNEASSLFGNSLFSWEMKSLRTNHGMHRGCIDRGRDCTERRQRMAIHWHSLCERDNVWTLKKRKFAVRTDHLRDESKEAEKYHMDLRTGE